MTNEEKILLAVSAVALVAVVIFRKKETVQEIIAPGVSQTVEAPPAKTGPEYLMYNQPYIWGPPVNNFLPAINATNDGGNAVATSLPYDCGCFD